MAFTSGYNNVSPGTGNGYLFVRNAVTGAGISKIPTYTSGTTPAGDTTTPSNLGKIAAWLDLESNNTAARLYARRHAGQPVALRLRRQPRPVRQ